MRNCREEQEVCNSLSVAVAGDDTGVYTLQETGKLPSSITTLGVAAQALLGHDRHGITRATLEVCKDVVPDVGLVLLLYSQS